jgi:hypothetical protein
MDFAPLVDLISSGMSIKGRPRGMERERHTHSAAMAGWLGFDGRSPGNTQAHILEMSGMSSGHKAWPL